MIHEKMVHGTSFNNRIAYVFNLTKSEEKQQQVEYITDTTISGNPISYGKNGKIESVEIESLVAEFEAQAGRHVSRTGDEHKKVFHAAISLAPGEQLTKHQWTEVCDAYANSLGFDQYIAVRHFDSEISHVHIVANRVVERDGNYRIASDSKDYERGMEVMREFEHKFGLQVVADPEAVETVSYDQREVNEAVRTGALPWRARLLNIVNAAREASAGQKWSDFIENCEKLGVGVKTRLSEEGRAVGVTFEYKGIEISGRKLKAATCTFSKLTTFGGIRYDAADKNEFEKIENANAIYEARLDRSAPALKEIRAESVRGLSMHITVEAQVTFADKPDIEKMQIRPQRVQRAGISHHAGFVADFVFSIPLRSQKAIEAYYKALEKWRAKLLKMEEEEFIRFLKRQVRMVLEIILSKAGVLRSINVDLAEKRADGVILCFCFKDFSCQPKNYLQLKSELSSAIHGNGMTYEDEVLSSVCACYLLENGYSGLELLKSQIMDYDGVDSDKARSILMKSMRRISNESLINSNTRRI